MSTVGAVRDSITRIEGPALVLTGAGISASAGIPTFRSSDPDAKNARILSASDVTARTVARTWKEWRPVVETARAHGPTPAHLALANWVHARGDVVIVTQNVDGLHEAAARQIGGNPASVAAIHGTMDEAKCLNPACSLVVELATLESDKEGVPRCGTCQARTRPNIVMFGEQLPTAACAPAVNASFSAHMTIVAGTSLEVFPAASLPDPARRAGRLSVWVNTEPPPFDPMGRQPWTWPHGTTDEVLPEILCI